MLVLNFSDEAGTLGATPVPCVHTPVLVRNIGHEMVVMVPVLNIVVMGNVVGEIEKVFEFHPKFSIIFSIGGPVSKNISPCLWHRFVSSFLSSIRVVSEIFLYVPWVSDLDDFF